MQLHIAVAINFRHIISISVTLPKYIQTLNLKFSRKNFQSRNSLFRHKKPQRISTAFTTKKKALVGLHLSLHKDRITGIYKTALPAIVTHWIHAWQWVLPLHHMTTVDTQRFATSFKGIQKYTFFNQHRHEHIYLSIHSYHYLEQKGKERTQSLPFYIMRKKDWNTWFGMTKPIKRMN